MKNAITVLMTLGLAVVLVGCASAAVSVENRGRFGEQILTPAKDFESRGLVFTEVEHEIISGRGAITGETFTHQALLREAHRLGADAIINVAIDMRIERITIGQTTTNREIWFGSALAIRFTDTLTYTTTTTSVNDNVTTTSTHHAVILNDWRRADAVATTPTAQAPGRGLFNRR